MLKKYFDALVNNEKLCNAVYYSSCVVASIAMSLMASSAYIHGVRRGCDITDEYYDKVLEKTEEK